MLGNSVPLGQLLPGQRLGIPGEQSLPSTLGMEHCKQSRSLGTGKGLLVLAAFAQKAWRLKTAWMVIGSPLFPQV